MNAPDIVVNNARAVAAALAGAAPLPGLDLALLVPDACGAASLVV